MDEILEGEVLEAGTQLAPPPPPPEPERAVMPRRTDWVIVGKDVISQVEQLGGEYTAVAASTAWFLYAVEVVAGTELDGYCRLKNMSRYPTREAALASIPPTAFTHLPRRGQVLPAAGAPAPDPLIARLVPKGTPDEGD